ncbi:hypothetical protein MCUN1_000360 [Malassezia cuniculi]|uniref:Uncharacterized protein n=1 Tax=Malassezia cuniculi TaxID=948313 RepID=A0AAF0EV84_9BASI|nr:hypothetical protein MCUN1_000360 [Malassezia cuniculi]
MEANLADVVSGGGYAAFPAGDADFEGTQALQHGHTTNMSLLKETSSDAQAVSDGIHGAPLNSLSSWTLDASELAQHAVDKSETINSALDEGDYAAAKQAAAERAAALEALQVAKQGYLDDDPTWDDIESESTASLDSVERYEREQDRLAMQEWEEGIQQLRMAFQLVIIPFFGKWLGRQWSYWAFSRWMMRH